MTRYIVVVVVKLCRTIIVPAPVLKLVHVRFNIYICFLFVHVPGPPKGVRLENSKFDSGSSTTGPLTLSLWDTVDRHFTRSNRHHTRSSARRHTSVCRSERR